MSAGFCQPWVKGRTSSCSRAMSLCVQLLPNRPTVVLPSSRHCWHHLCPFPLLPKRCQWLVTVVSRPPGFSTTCATISRTIFALFKIVGALYFAGWPLRQDLCVGSLFRKWPQGTGVGSGEKQEGRRMKPRLYYQASRCHGQLRLHPAGDSELLGGMDLKIVLLPPAVQRWPKGG